MKQTPIVVAISGHIGSGKDTLMNAFEELYQDTWIINHYAFADSLKRSFCIIFNWPYEDTQTTAGKCKIIPELGITIGKFLQDFGMAGRSIHKDLWLFNVDNKIKASSDNVSIITDCRFPNEVEFIQKSGGYVIRVNRKDELIDPKCYEGRDRNHISETALDDCDKFDLVIDNNGTKEELLGEFLKFLTSRMNKENA